MAWHVQDWSTSPLLSQSNWKHLLIYFIRSIHWDLVGSKLVGLHIPVDCHILVFPVWLRSPSCRHINHDSNYRRWAFWDWPAFEEQTLVVVLVDDHSPAVGMRYDGGWAVVSDIANCLWHFQTLLTLLWIVAVTSHFKQSEVHRRLFEGSVGFV